MEIAASLEIHPRRVLAKLRCPCNAQVGCLFDAVTVEVAVNPPGQGVWSRFVGDQLCKVSDLLVWIFFWLLVTKPKEAAKDTHQDWNIG